MWAGANHLLTDCKRRGTLFAGFTGSRGGVNRRFGYGNAGVGGMALFNGNGGTSRALLPFPCGLGSVIDRVRVHSER
jgi:hypothetical protein